MSPANPQEMPVTTATVSEPQSTQNGHASEAAGPIVTKFTPPEIEGPKAKVKGEEQVWLDLGLIDVPNDYRKKDPLLQAHVNKLAGDFMIEGQLEPIQVRAMEGGRYELMRGDHRRRAAEKAGWKVIKAIISNRSDLEARLSRFGSSIHQRALTGPALDHALGQWAATYEQINPDARGAVVKAQKGGQGRAAKVKGAKGEKYVPKAEPKQTAAQAVAETLGIDEQTASRAIARGKAFSDSDVAILEAQKVKTHDQTRIARIKDENTRGAIIRDIAAGLVPERAIAKHTSPEGTPVEDVSGSIPEEQQSDQQWIAAMPLFQSKQCVLMAFIEQALAYRRFWTLVPDKKARDLYKALRYPTRKGFTGLLIRVLNCHPSLWRTCGVCNGTGKFGNKTCGGEKGCGGMGFVVPVPKILTDADAKGAIQDAPPDDAPTNKDAEAILESKGVQGMIDAVYSKRK